MGTWAIGPFDNDSAADWCGDLNEAPKAQRLGIIRQTLTAVAEEGDYLDAGEATEVVAAAAVVAAHQPRSARIETAYAPDFLIAGELLDLPGDLVPLTDLALDRVIAPESELRELWEEAGELSEWLATIGAIRAELHGDGHA